MASNVIRFLTPTVGATPAATYSFMTHGYKPPRLPRSMGQDEIHNQNGKFKYIYDSGPGFLEWDPFEIVCDDKFAPLLSGANGAQQKANLDALWQYIGPFQIGTPDGVYNAYWAAGNAFQPRFQKFPIAAGDKIDYAVTVQIQEA